jgi:hypothetical protein
MKQMSTFLTNNLVNTLNNFKSPDSAGLRGTKFQTFFDTQVILEFNQITKYPADSMEIILPSSIKILKAGYYEIFGGVFVSGINAGDPFQTELRILVNDVIIYSQSLTNYDDSQFGLNVNVDYDFQVGDVIQLGVFASSTAIIAAEDGAFASRFFIIRTR